MSAIFAIYKDALVSMLVILSSAMLLQLQAGRHSQCKLQTSWLPRSSRTHLDFEIFLWLLLDAIISSKLHLSLSDGELPLPLAPSLWINVKDFRWTWALVIVWRRGSGEEYIISNVTAMFLPMSGASIRPTFFACPVLHSGCFPGHSRLTRLPQTSPQPWLTACA